MVCSTLTVKICVLLFSISSAQAQSCAPGTRQSGGVCVQCAPGTYTKEWNQSKCLEARKGYYVPSYGAKSETPCSRGAYTDKVASSSCKSCPAGYMCPSDALANPQQCSPGRYSTGGAVECTWCSPGYFNSVHAATGCCACCAGWFNNNPSLTNCQRCSNQHPYSSPGARSCSASQGKYAPMSSCSMNGRNCPLTFNEDASQLPIRRDLDHIPYCPRTGEKACPVYNTQFGIKTKVGYECRTVANDLWACGGCPTEDLDASVDGTSGEDCTEIPHVNSVECKQGNCVIRSCAEGYQTSDNQTSCLPVFSLNSLLTQRRHAIHPKNHQ